MSDSVCNRWLRMAHPIGLIGTGHWDSFCFTLVFYLKLTVVQCSNINWRSRFYLNLDSPGEGSIRCASSVSYPRGPVVAGRGVRLSLRPAFPRFWPRVVYWQEESDIFGVSDSPAVQLRLGCRLELLLSTARTSSPPPRPQPPTSRPVQSHQVTIEACSKQVFHSQEVPIWSSMRCGEGVG